MNIYGLTLIGTALFLGLFARWAALGGTVLLTLYYFAYPPFGFSLFGTGEGHLFVVDKIFIEATVLVFFFFYKGKAFGIDNLIRMLRYQGNSQPLEEDSKIPETNTRREALKNLAAIPALGIMGFSAYESGKRYDADVISGATVKVNQVSLSELKGSLPCGKIENHSISRLVMGGNLIGGWAHSRDLIYVPELFKAYNTERKIFETLMLAEKAGINTISVAHVSNPLMEKYKKATGSKIKVITQVLPPSNDVANFDVVNMAIDAGTDIIQIQGAYCDSMVKAGRIDLVGKMLDLIKRQGYTAGLGSHEVESLIICEENGIIPDYYMKTMHHEQYWSAHPRENRVPFEVDGSKSLDHNRFHDNMFCLFPEKTVEFVKKVKIPVMGFKVLAAGAIGAQDGFKWAFENGADFICVGMFDFQVVNDVNICIDTLNNMKGRTREWYG
jgi:hypothetical protein